MLEVSTAIHAAEAKGREELKESIKEVRDELKGSIKLYVGLGVAGGNALVALVSAYVGPHQTQQAASAVAHAVIGALPV